MDKIVHFDAIYQTRPHLKATRRDRDAARQGCNDVNFFRPPYSYFIKVPPDLDKDVNL